MGTYEEVKRKLKSSAEGKFSEKSSKIFKKNYLRNLER